MLAEDQPDTPETGKARAHVSGLLAAGAPLAEVLEALTAALEPDGAGSACGTPAAAQGERPSGGSCASGSQRDERDFRALAENLPNLCWMADGDGWIYWYNRRWYEFTGTTPAQMEGWGWQSVHDPTTLPEVMANWTGAIAAKRPFEMTFPLRAADNSFRPFLTRIVPLFGPDGTIEKWFGTNVDIGAQVAAEAALRASEKRLRDLNADLEQQVLTRARERARTWEVSPDLLSVINPQGYFEATNPAWTVTLGWTADALARTHWSKFVHPEDLPPSERAFGALIRGEPVLRFENRYLHRDGSSRWLSWVAVPEQDKFYCSARDVTAERARADALAERTAERDRLWRNARDLLLISDRDGHFLAVNPAWETILGWRPDEVIGRSYLDFIHPDDHASSRGALTQAGMASGLPTYENRLRHRDGGYRWVSWAASPDSEQIYASGRHVTDERAQAEALRQAEEAVRQLQRMEALGKLAGGIAHDFNNVLQAVASGLNLIERRAQDPDAVRRIARMAGDAAARGAGVTARLLAFARKSELRAEPVRTRAMLQNLWEMLAPTLGAGITVRVEMGAAEPPPLLVDKAQLETVLVNLAVNASDAMPDGGTLSIVADSEVIPAGASLPAGAYVRLDLADTGGGMTAETLARASEPFFTTKPAGKGTGLGLAMARGFARQSGGDLAIRSAPGEGTTVTLWLPQAVDAAGVEIGAPSGAVAGIVPPAAGQPARTRVLIVDDDAMVREVLALQLEQAFGHEVLQAPDGLAALERLDGGEPVDLLVTDFAMPGMNGLLLTQEVRRRRADLPVILLTGYADTDTQEAIESLCDPVTVLLRKPIMGDALASAVSRFAPGIARAAISTAA